MKITPNVPFLFCPTVMHPYIHTYIYHRCPKSIIHSMFNSIHLVTLVIVQAHQTVKRAWT